MVRTAFPVSDAKAKQIAEETRKDAELKAVIDNMYTGWPTSSSPKFQDIRGDLCVVDGILLKQNRIVIPQSLKQDILHRIH